MSCKVRSISVVVSCTSGETRHTATQYLAHNESGSEVKSLAGYGNETFCQSQTAVNETALAITEVQRAFATGDPSAAESAVAAAVLANVAEQNETRSTLQTAITNSTLSPEELKEVVASAINETQARKEAALNLTRNLASGMSANATTGYVAALGNAVDFFAEESALQLDALQVNSSNGLTTREKEEREEMLAAAQRQSEAILETLIGASSTSTSTSTLDGLKDTKTPGEAGALAKISGETAKIIGNLGALKSEAEKLWDGQPPGPTPPPPPGPTPPPPPGPTPPPPPGGPRVRRSDTAQWDYLNNLMLETFGTTETSSTSVVKAAIRALAEDGTLTNPMDTDDGSVDELDDTDDGLRLEAERVSVQLVGSVNGTIGFSRDEALSNRVNLSRLDSASWVDGLGAQVNGSELVVDAGLGWYPESGFSLSGDEGVRHAPYAIAMFYNISAPGDALDPSSYYLTFPYSGSDDDFPLCKTFSGTGGWAATFHAAGPRRGDVLTVNITGSAVTCKVFGGGILTTVHKRAADLAGQTPIYLRFPEGNLGTLSQAQRQTFKEKVTTGLVREVQKTLPAFQVSDVLLVELYSGDDARRVRRSGGIEAHVTLASDQDPVAIAGAAGNIGDIEVDGRSFEYGGACGGGCGESSNWVDGSGEAGAGTEAEAAAADNSVAIGVGVGVSIAVLLLVGTVVLKKSAAGNGGNKVAPSPDPEIGRRQFAPEPVPEQTPAPASSGLPPLVAPVPVQEPVTPSASELAAKAQQQVKADMIRARIEANNASKAQEVQMEALNVANNMNEAVIVGAPGNGIDRRPTDAGRPELPSVLPGLPKPSVDILPVASSIEAPPPPPPPAALPGASPSQGPGESTA